DPVGTVTRLAEFLGVPHTPELCRQVADACTIDKMREADKIKDKSRNVDMLMRMNMYRKDGVERPIAALLSGHFFTTSTTYKRFSFLPSAGIQISGVNSTDFGSYQVRVTYFRDGAPQQETQTASLTLPDAPVLQDGRLVAHVLPKPVFDPVTGESHVQLSCGTFLSRGSNPVSVTWKTPKGLTLDSTAYSNGHFLLNLPNPVHGGWYQCEIDNPSPSAMSTCMRDASSLQRGAFVDVDEVQVRLTLAESLQGATREIRSELDRQDKVDANFADEMENLRARDTVVKAELEQQKTAVTAQIGDLRAGDSKLEEELRQLRGLLDEQKSSVEVLTKQLSELKPSGQQTIKLHSPDRRYQPAVHEKTGHHLPLSPGRRVGSAVERLRYGAASADKHPHRYAYWSSNPINKPLVLQTLDGVERPIAALLSGHFFVASTTYKRFSFLPSAGIQISGVNSTDFGSYQVRVTYFRDGAPQQETQTASLTLPDAPVLQDGRLVAHVLPKPVFDPVTGESHVQLSCGTFLSRGSNPVSVTWKTPKGLTLDNTAYSNGQFLLNLPNPVHGGWYQCEIDNPSPSVMSTCMRDASSLERGAFVDVDEVQVRLTLAESLQGATREIRSELDRQDKVVASFADEMENLRAQDTAVKAELEQQKTAVTAQIGDLRAGDSKLEEELRQLRGLLDEQKSSVGALTKQLSELKPSGQQ
ncbi:hypothetical protein BaRGS_00034189, partial [Batillaria attramentaria]